MSYKIYKPQIPSFKYDIGKYGNPITTIEIVGQIIFNSNAITNSINYFKGIIDPKFNNQYFSFSYKNNNFEYKDKFFTLKFIKNIFSFYVYHKDNDTSGLFVNDIINVEKLMIDFVKL